MKKIKLSILLFLILLSCSGGDTVSSSETDDNSDNSDTQPTNFTIYQTGNSNIQVTPSGGICLMGGAAEDDNGMRWFLNRANGGDIVVLRTSGSDGYNDYMYQDLGVTINSVNSIVFEEASEHPDIITLINNAEGIWFAGGDQGTYIDYWRDTAIQQAIKNAIARGAVLGGTSAGMAIFGDCVWTGLVLTDDFLDIDLFDGVIFDTHFSERDRESRLKDFISQSSCTIGVGADENTAITFENDGSFNIYAYTSDKKVFFIEADENVEARDGNADGNGPFHLDDIFSTSPATGLLSKTMIYDGETREYLIYIPESYDSNTPLPVLFAFHGWGGYASNFVNTANFRELADNQDFIAVYPQGLVCDGGTAWNSNGADFSYTLACYKSDLVTAMSSVSGLMPLEASNACTPTHPTSVIVFHGTSDNVRPYDGIDGYLLSVDEAINYWTGYNNTDTTPQTDTIDNVDYYSYQNGDNNSIVELYKVNGGGHEWFGIRINGLGIEEIMWEFFSHTN